MEDWRAGIGGGGIGVSCKTGGSLTVDGVAAATTDDLLRLGGIVIDDGGTNSG